MKFLSVAVLLSLPLATQAMVDCCADSECLSCGFAASAPSFTAPATCTEGGWAAYKYQTMCTPIATPSGRSSAADGDPHIKTWSGTWFDYHGECDLVMMHVDEFQDKGKFSVHARTKIRADYSFISNAVLRIGEETLEVASWGDYAINTVGGGIPDSRESTAVLGSIAGFDIEHSQPNDKQHSFRIDLGEGQVIEFATFKDLVSVRFHEASADHFATTHGLMGDFNGRKVARDGVTVMEDTNAFGQEWQVQPEEGMLFVTEPAPGKCKLPDASIEEARRLRTVINKDVAEKACFKHQGAAFDACVLDVQLTGDVAIASAGGY